MSRAIRSLSFSLFALFSFGSPLSAQQSGGRSVSGGDRIVSLEVRNTGNVELDAIWLNFDGRGQSYGKVAPGATMQVQTYPGHLWEFRSRGRPVGQYRAVDAGGQRFEVGMTETGDTPAAPPVPKSAQPQQGGGKKGWLERLIEKQTGTPVKGGQSSGPSQPTPPVVPRTATQVPAAGLSSQEAQQLVAFHNQVRAEVGVGPVAWSPEIAAYAQEWADEMARTGKFEHRKRARYGENLAAGSSPRYSMVEGARGWYGEKKFYKAGAPFSQKFMKAGHYTQMVWRESTMIGAATAVCQKGPYKGWTFVVCNYSPGGNFIGEPAY